MKRVDERRRSEKRILFFSRDPGAANVIVPVFVRMEELGNHKSYLAGKEYALQSYQNEGLVGEDIGAVVYDVKSARAYIEKYAFDLVVTGVHSNDLTDRYLWQAARACGVSSMAIRDQWMNSRARFVMQMPGVDVSTAPLVMPDYVCVIDELMREEMIAEGLSDTNIVITGQPYFETVARRMKNIDDETIKETKKELDIPEASFVLCFASEPILEAYEDPMFLGYTQHTILDAIVLALQELTSNLAKSVHLVIKLHPRNDPALFDRYKKEGAEYLAVTTNQLIQPQKIIAVSDAVLGMSSMLLLESVIAGKPIASVQIGLKREDPFILSRIGYLKSVTDASGLKPMLQRIIRGEERPPENFVKNIEPTDNVVDVIESILG